MRLPRIWHFAVFVTYFSNVCISHILAFSAALNTFCNYFLDADDLLLQEVEEVVALL